MSLFLSDSSNVKDKEKRAPKIRPNRMKVSVNIPTEEELAAIKHKKKVCNPKIM